MNSYKSLTIIIFLLFCGASFASCAIEANKIDFSQITYSLKEDSTADLSLSFGVSYEKECLLSEFVNVDVNSNNRGNISVGTVDIVSDEVPCPIKFQELVLKSLPGLSNGLNCYGIYFADKNYLQMRFYGTTTKLSNASDKNFVFTLEKNDLFSQFGKNSSLTIILPQNASIFYFSPKETTFMTPTILSWSHFAE